MHPHQLDQTLSERKRNLANNNSTTTSITSAATTKSSSALQRFLGNANYRFLLGQIITCLVFIIYGVLMVQQIVENFLVRSFYFETMILFIFILIPIYLLFTFSGTANLKGREFKRRDEQVAATPSELLVRMVLWYFGVLFGGACLIYVGVTLFGFTPFMRIPSSNNFQSARSDVANEQAQTTLSNNSSNWICAKKIPSSILNSEDHYVFSLFSKCHIFSIDEIMCCIVWCILSSLVVFVQPMATLLQWNNIKEYTNLVVFEKTARVSSISFNLKPVAPLRTFLLVHLICIWISGFVIPLDWEKDWQYFPLCTTVGLIFGSITNLIISLVTMKHEEDETKEE